MRPAGLPGNTVFLGQGDIRNLWSGECLDAASQTARTDGGRVQTWVCNLSTQQQWSVYQDNANGHYFLVNGYGKCLDAKAQTLTSFPATVQLWGCTGGTNQQWVLNQNSTGMQPTPGIVQIWNVAATWNVLDEDRNAGLANGAKIQLWGNTFAANQSWRGFIANLTQ